MRNALLKVVHHEEEQGGQTRLPYPQSQKGEVITFDVPPENIYKDTQRFQRRFENFSDDSVEKILKTMQDGEFKRINFDPIKLRYCPEDEKLYVLAGFSRLEAFMRAKFEQPPIRIEGEIVQHIPSRIFFGSEEDAKEIADISNFLATPHTLPEKIIYVRNRRLTRNDDKRLKEHLQFIIEGKRNSGKLFAMSHLHPNRKALERLAQLEGKEEESFNRIKTSAYFTGHLRMKLPELSDTHEDEIFLRLNSEEMLQTRLKENLGVQQLYDIIKKHIQDLKENNKFREDTYLNLAKTDVVGNYYKAQKRELLLNIYHTRQEVSNKTFNLLVQNLALQKEELQEALLLQVKEVFNELYDKISQYKDLVSLENENAHHIEQQRKEAKKEFLLAFRHVAKNIAQKGDFWTLSDIEPHENWLKQIMLQYMRSLIDNESFEIKNRKRKKLGNNDNKQMTLFD